MSRKVALFVVPGMQENPKAIEAVGQLEQLPDVKVDIVACPPSMQELYVCPFVKDEKDRGYYGLAGIESFVNDQRRQSKGANGHSNGHSNGHRNRKT